MSNNNIEIPGIDYGPGSPRTEAEPWNKTLQNVGRREEQSSEVSVVNNLLNNLTT